MDSITHIALGAVAGEAIAGKYLGKRAMLYGALAQSLPDIDFIGAFFLSPADNLLFHRGFTHSLLFALIATGVFALSAFFYHRSQKIPGGMLIMLFGTELLLHLVLDVCNAYGVGLLEPFSSKRFSLNVLFVADPFYSIPLGIAMLILIFMDSKNQARRFWIALGLIVSSGYLLYAISNKLMVERETILLLKQQNIHYKRLLTTPTPMNTWLWYVVAETDSGFYTGHRAIADDRDQQLKLRYVSRNEQLLFSYKSNHDVRQLIKFSQDYFVVSQSKDTLIFNDLRFGEIAGWAAQQPQYVFHYYINHPDANQMVIQRGRFSNWNQETFSSMLRRMRGKD
jgi:inner membrane protein